MGADPKTSVLNKILPGPRRQQSFCHRRRLASSPIADKNPTLTIMALSWRASEYLLDASKEGKSVRNVGNSSHMAPRHSEIFDHVRPLAGSVLRVIPAQAAEYAHHMVAAGKSRVPGRSIRPEIFLSPPIRRLCSSLCQTIIPEDADSGGAIEAGRPEFIDLLTSENRQVSAEIRWRAVVAGCPLHRPLRQYISTCTPEQQKEILDLIAFAAKRERPGTEPGSGVLCVPAQFYCGRLFHQQDRNRISGLHRKHIPAQLPGLPPVPEA